mmetsp:Transcript_12246/g.49167  ORF Transcript_12246/g.49167 Transcript_12246/m.49167 type:complete len:275 (-) Transcript_12246:54-878(-)
MAFTARASRTPAAARSARSRDASVRLLARLAAFDASASNSFLAMSAPSLASLRTCSTRSASLVFANSRTSASSFFVRRPSSSASASDSFALPSSSSRCFVERRSIGTPSAFLRMRAAPSSFIAALRSPSSRTLRLMRSSHFWRRSSSDSASSGRAFSSPKECTEVGTSSSASSKDLGAAGSGRVARAVGPGRAGDCLRPRSRDLRPSVSSTLPSSSTAGRGGRASSAPTSTPSTFFASRNAGLVCSPLTSRSSTAWRRRPRARASPSERASSAL